MFAFIFVHQPHTDHYAVVISMQEKKPSARPFCIIAIPSKCAQNHRVRKFVAPAASRRPWATQRSDSAVTILEHLVYYLTIQRAKDYSGIYVVIVGPFRSRRTIVIVCVVLPPTIFIMRMIYGTARTSWLQAGSDAGDLMRNRSGSRTHRASTKRNPKLYLYMLYFMIA